MDSEEWSTQTRTGPDRPTVQDALGMAGTALDTVLSAEPTLLSGGALTAAIIGLDQVAARADAAWVRLLTELIDRGELTGGLHQMTDWLTTHCPGLARSHALDLVRLATATGGPDRVAHEPVVTAVTTGEISTRRGSMILRALTAVRGALDDDTYTGDVQIVLDVARRSEVFTERDLTRILDRLIATAMTERDHEQRDTSARAVRGINESSLADGSVIRFLINADPEGAALLRSVLTSPLAAPTPAADGSRDPRPATARRYDALLTVLARGMREPGDTPATKQNPTAQVLVTTHLEPLTQALAGAAAGEDTGSHNLLGGCGAGLSATGDILSPATVRKLSCDAEIIPAILGGASEPLDLGRGERTASRAQRRALWLRDGGCTIPGCTTPPAWCEAHHIVHWSRGGASDLCNYALLCPRHHTEVHRLDLTAEIDPHAPPRTAVRWKLPRSGPIFAIGRGP